MERSKQIQEFANTQTDCEFYDDTLVKGIIIGAEWADKNPRDGLVDIVDVCSWLSEHLGTRMSDGDYDYGEEYIVSDFDRSYDLIEALRNAMVKKQ